MGPMVFEKALSIARNIQHQKGEKITDFTLAVNDIAKSEWDWSRGEPGVSHPDYYLRWLKTFHRMGSRDLEYYRLDNRLFLHHLQDCLELLQI